MTDYYDAGMLIALERADQRAWLRIREAESFGIIPVVTAPVLAQVWRGGRAMRLSEMLAICQLVPFDPDDAKAVGELCATAGTSDVVDAHLAYLARGPGSVILTSDAGDLAALVDAGGYPTELVSV